MTLIDDVVKIRRFQTAELWTIRSPKNPTPRVVSFHCPTCPDPDNSRLVHVVLETVPDEGMLPDDAQRKVPKIEVLLHVTRWQIEEILASFGRMDGGQTLRNICALPRDPNQPEERG